ncbi:MAG: family metallopeptidase [Bacillota bacterium]|nr:family metallopeptidase [Bacillota bacterium]
MKKSKNQNRENINRFWNNITSEMKKKLNIKEKDISENNNVRDMGDTHTPFSRLDLTGLNRQQAKELIEKVIDERLEQISQIELKELRIDDQERDRQKAKAAERISERRSRRKQKASGPAQTSVTEDGGHSDYQQISVFDIIQPESFPSEVGDPPIEGQLAITAVMPDSKEEDTEPAADRSISLHDSPESAADRNIEFAEELEASVQTEFGEIMSPETEAVSKSEKRTGKKSKKSKQKKQREDQVLFDTIQGLKGESEAESLSVAAVNLATAEVIPAATAHENMAATNATPVAAIAEDTVAAVTTPVVAPAENTAAAEAVPTEKVAQNIVAVEADAMTPVGNMISPKTNETPKSTSINTSLDEAIDLFFAFYEKNRSRALWAWRIVSIRTGAIVTGNVIPAAIRFHSLIRSKTQPILAGIDQSLGLSAKTQHAAAFLSKKEMLISDKMCGFINLIDKGCDWIAHILVVTGNKICKIYNHSKDYVENHKKQFLIGFGCSAAAAAAITITIGSMTAYEYVYSGKVLGVVKNQEDVYKTIEIIGDKLSYEYDAEITIDKDKDIQFNKVIAFKQDLDDKEDILNRLTYMRDMKANGHGIFVDGNMVAVLDSEETAEEILNAIQSTYLKQADNIQYKDVGFAENVTIKDVETKLGNIDSREKALEYMMTGAVEKNIHVVAQGETFSGIAKQYGIKQNELQVSNPGITPDKLQIGQEISLNQIVPLVTVQTVEVAEYTETIPFEITYENTASLYKKEQTVKSKGANGEKDVVAEIVRNNGVEVSRKEISSTILSEPVAQVVLVGTKDPPPLIGTGNLIYPIRGTLTSRYGTRWGRMHSGIDLAAPIGTKIKASDGGKVVFAGYNGSLGYMVKIDHGGGKVTLYGHCSKLFVKAGDRVYQGQHIANVGNTGRSTGPHVHFEVHINGKTKNPLNYL